MKLDANRFDIKDAIELLPIKQMQNFFFHFPRNPCMDIAYTISNCFKFSWFAGYVYVIALSVVECTAYTEKNYVRINFQCFINWFFLYKTTLKITSLLKFCMPVYYLRLFLI